MKYLTENYSSLEELKKAYKSWAKKLHPDVGGSNEEMKILNNEFDFLVSHKIFTKSHAKSTAKTQEQQAKNERDWEEYSGRLGEILRSIIHMEGIKIEVIGVWVWITGNTFPYKDELKSLGFHYSGSKKAWYFPTTGYQKIRSKKSLNLLREIWGTETIKQPKKQHKSAIETR